MTDKPIIFSAPMVRAILDGRKTQTRRVLKPSPGRQAKWLSMETLHKSPSCYIATVDGQLGAQMQHPHAGTTQPYGKVDAMSPLGWVRLPYAPGDRLWVRETFVGARGYDGLPPSKFGNKPIWYSADGEPDRERWWHLSDRKRSPRHMPRWASRLTLIVEDVRVQRLQEISARDSIAEGVECQTCKAMLRSACGGKGCFASMVAFRNLWNSLNAKRGYDWETNPWVVALTFRPIQKNIDALNNEAAE